jgi:hypothetical protein
MKQRIFFLLFTVAVCAFGTELSSRLPSRDPAVVLPLLRALPATSTYPDVCHILGTPELDIGSSSPNAIFTLTDGSHVHVKTTRVAAPDQVFKLTTITLYLPHHSVVEGEGQLLFGVTPPKDLTARTPANLH